jgi:hypothetical protein
VLALALAPVLVLLVPKWVPVLALRPAAAQMAEVTEAQR